MDKHLDEKWLQNALADLDSSQDYIDDDGFSQGVMARIAEEESNRFGRLRQFLTAGFGLLVALMFFSQFSGAMLYDFVEQQILSTSILMMVPAGIVFSALATFFGTRLLRV